MNTFLILLLATAFVLGILRVVYVRKYTGKAVIEKEAVSAAPSRRRTIRSVEKGMKALQRQTWAVERDLAIKLANHKEHNRDLEARMKFNEFARRFEESTRK